MSEIHNPALRRILVERNLVPLHSDFDRLNPGSK
jgi:hypothetical protein